MEMNHLIGQRFNLISKSDIRYVGTLHEINPEASTIALENVMSFGSEGRRGNPAEEVPPLHQSPHRKKHLGYQKTLPFSGARNDLFLAKGLTRDLLHRIFLPRALPSCRREPVLLLPVTPRSTNSSKVSTLPTDSDLDHLLHSLPVLVFRRMVLRPDGTPPPGHGFPPGPGQFQPPMPIGPGQQPGPQQPGPQQPGPQRPGPPGAPPAPKPTSELPNAPTPPIESKPTVSEALQGPASSAPLAAVPQKNGRVMPAIPIAAPKPAPTAAHIPSAPRGNNQSITDATAAATAAVAAAMAKLPQPGAQKQAGQPEGAVDALTQQMNNMRPYDNTRPARGGHHHPRGGRGGARPQHQAKKIEVPQSDYDFQTANAKFNKQDLVKEAIATGVPVAEAEAHAAEEAESMESLSNAGVVANHGYNRGSSFFDNISSEARDREENTTRVGGREWRGEEEKRNMETFGQGSVDGYRPNYRGRGRGRGYGRGRGGYSRGYGRGRGGRVPSESTGVPSQG
ncbi:Lsm14 N-terminal [Penicillium mononematosum]|uniref:Lsm14 N-terminal n=1 Tax=Penicillium mononematosum TaxID=268346 RepID=UPI002549551A|nr:Lsm14 N-terminal [Penicillium mononematosum]KAJ6181091.1 Lsm14 N-terminal [Penicillium mononematosum]